MSESCLNELLTFLECIDQWYGKASELKTFTNTMMSDKCVKIDQKLIKLHSQIANKKLITAVVI